MADVVVRKSDNHFISGTANVVISGFFADKRPYNAGATVTFNGDKTFTIECTRSTILGRYPHGRC